MLRLGLIGCGGIAEQVYLRILPRLRDARVLAVADVDPARRAAACVRLRGAEAYSEPYDLIDRATVDAVIVATPTHLHAPIAVAALERGLHVYVEKPLAASLGDGARVLAAWRRAGTVGMIGFNARFNPLHMRLRELIRSGRAGEPVCVRTVFTTAPHHVPHWKRSRATGGGVLLDLASHHVDLMRFLFGREVVRARATLRSRRSEDDTALVEMELEQGPLVQSFFSLAAAERERVDVYGERARLSVGRFTSLTVQVEENPAEAFGAIPRVIRRGLALRHMGAGLRARWSPLREPGYARALECFVRVAAARSRGRDPGVAPGADIADGYRALTVLDAAERSARSGTRAGSWFSVPTALPETSPPVPDPDGAAISVPVTPAGALRIS